MMKKIFKKLGKLLKWLVILFFAMGFIIDVFDSNIYYYAHSKYTDKRRLPGVVVDNLTEIVNDYNRDEFTNYSFDFDGDIILTFSDVDKTISIFSKSGNFYYIDGKLEGTKISILLDDNYQKIDASKYPNDEDGKVEMNENEQKQIFETVDKITSDMMENVSTPLFNFQWIYDYFYTDRTVDKYD